MILILSLGKSALCGAIAREVSARFYTISSSDLISSWSGQSEKLIRSLFDIVLSNEERKYALAFSHVIIDDSKHQLYSWMKWIVYVERGTIMKTMQIEE